ncbi:hypothetical protein [Streptomyces sp. NBC_00140]|uniref:hypothetical protein n=1 Tax=Streptomyces sp. NBC_00140 TaxID=2975664 RepID=UPI00225A11C2|nr:hypothetical protein [Streptomyces sp. NBC_00140]MCX5336921.1 ead/Ea22-like family protein [Streptomyces sp. NBC_00140]MCX5338404.1 ead/Ea22-like family protein [Streptomyces sp. NBC_00140]
MTAPADEIRAAAEQLRKLAEAATDGPWISETSPVYGFRVGTVNMRAWVAFTGDYADEPDESGPDAAYIAAIHPGVGLALADWLDYEADLMGPGSERRGRTTRALAVARAILGGRP